MKQTILLTGATGYIGGRLLKRLEAQGRRVRCLCRDPSRLRGRVKESTELAVGDVLDAASLPGAFDGVATAFYLVHALSEAGDFEAKERRGAEHFAAAAKAAGTGRIVYLGGLGGDEADSPHLRSRHAVGEILRASGVPTIEFRASIVLGAGSLSFELVKTLVERLPVMITPRWVATEAQPIAIADVLEYLLAALDHDPAGNPVYEIGGPDRVSYAGLMKVFARKRGLRRLLIPVPVLTPWLSSLWLGLVTPLNAAIGRKLIESIRHPTVVRDPRALEIFPIRPMGIEAAMDRAMQALD